MGRENVGEKGDTNCYTPATQASASHISVGLFSSNKSISKGQRKQKRKFSIAIPVEEINMEVTAADSLGLLR